MEKVFYTYAYLRKDGSPYYIGKGKEQRAFKRTGRNCACPKDKSRIIFLKENLTEEEALNHEIEMITFYGRKDKGTGILRNLTDGGEGITGASRTKKFKKRISETHKGKTISKAHKKAISKANSGKSPSTKTRAKISQALAGKKRPPISKETRKKMSESAKKRHARSKK